jgi:RimJ/RimL family protein N-acetyltransferase
MSNIKPKEIKLKNGKTIKIRTAVPADAQKIIVLVKSILKEKVYIIHELDEFKDTLESRALQIRKFKKAPGKLFLVADAGYEIAGLINFNNWDTRKTMHTGFLSIYTKKKYRGIGIGKALLSELIDWAGKNKIIHKMSLAVFSGNKNAIALYKKIGFKIEGICPKDIKINGKYYDSIFMYIFVK